MIAITNIIVVSSLILGLAIGTLVERNESLAFIKQFIIRKNRTFLIILIFAFTFASMWLYNHVRLFEQNFEHPKRLQRICGENAFEKETIRWALLEYSTSAHLERKIIELVLCSIAIGFATFMVPAMADQDSALVLCIVIVCLMLLFLNLVHAFFGFLSMNPIESNQLVIKYKTDLKHIQNLLRKALQDDTAQPNGAYRRLRESIVKRIVLENNFESVHDAIDLYDKYTAQNMLNVLAYIEFHEDRDYAVLKEVVELTSLSAEDKEKAQTSLDSLKTQVTYNFEDEFKKKLKPIKIAFLVLAFVIGYIWMRILSDNLSYTTTIIMFVLMLLVVTYAMS